MASAETLDVAIVDCDYVLRITQDEPDEPGGRWSVQLLGPAGDLLAVVGLGDTSRDALAAARHFFANAVNAAEPFSLTP